MSKKDKRIRETVDMDQETLMELWDGVNGKGDTYTINDETYAYIDKINTSDQSDGPSWDYIIQRKSDGKYFKFNVWDGGNNGYIFEDEYLEEVFEKIKITYV